MNFQEALDFIESRFPQFQIKGAEALNPSLDNIKRLSFALGNPHNNFPTVHIAGTNGKGSSAHMIAAVFQSAGYKTGLYTSPHLLSFRERIKINGVQISEESIISFIQYHKHLLSEVDASFFEITVLLAFWHFSETKVDVAIIEVGLGGRFDATNIITPLVSLITNIGLDHQKILGETITSIAKEKAGIIKKGIPVVISEKQKAIEHVFITKAEEKQAPIYFAQDEFSIEVHESSINILKQNKNFISALKPSLKGHYQYKNILGIIMVVNLLQEKFPQLICRFLKDGIEKFSVLTNFIGRWQILQNEPLIICDTAHNLEGFKEVIQQLLDYNKNIYMILGFSRDKHWQEVFQLIPKNICCLFCEFPSQRSVEKETMLIEAKKNGMKNIQTFEDISLAYEAVLSQTKPEDLVFVGGSNYLVASFLSYKNK